jgi:Ca-activated chloride channel family protein
MPAFVITALLVFLSVSSLSAQSGRRIATVPTPMATPLTDDSTPQYSESKPRTPRNERVPNRFPNISIRKDEPAEAATLVQTNVPAESDVEGETLRVETNLITIPVSVFDRNGLYIPGLTQKNFKIFEDGVEQDIAYFGTSEKPFTVALVIDVSPSTAYKIEEIQRAARAFVDQLQPHDNVIVIEFDQSVNVLAKATNDREKIYKAIRRADFGNGTSLYEAVDVALRKQLAKIPGRKAMVLFTDGVDTTSYRKTYDNTLKYAEESDSLIFPIYYNTFFENRQPPSTFPNIFVNAPSSSAEEYALGRSYLNELADATGGRVFRPESTPGGLTAAFEGIAEELRRQYNIGYVPKDEGKPGQRKQIKVRVDRPNLVLRARDSYIVGAVVSQTTETAPQSK